MTTMTPLLALLIGWDPSMAANNGWHLQPDYAVSPLVEGPFDWVLVALGAAWGLRLLHRWWQRVLEEDRLRKEQRRRQTQRLVDAAMRRARARRREGRDRVPGADDEGARPNRS
jgi:hypothetical protein